MFLGIVIFAKLSTVGAKSTKLINRSCSFPGAVG